MVIVLLLLGKSPTSQGAGINPDRFFYKNGKQPGVNVCKSGDSSSFLETARSNLRTEFLSQETSPTHIVYQKAYG